MSKINFNENELTGYAATKLINAVLEENNLKTIPPQMVYTYLQKGYIKKNENGFVDVNSLGEWMTKYVAKKKLLSSTTN